MLIPRMPFSVLLGAYRAHGDARTMARLATSSLVSLAPHACPLTPVASLVQSGMSSHLHTLGRTVNDGGGSMQKTPSLGSVADTRSSTRMGTHGHFSWWAYQASPWRQRVRYAGRFTAPDGRSRTSGTRPSGSEQQRPHSKPTPLQGVPPTAFARDSHHGQKLSGANKATVTTTATAPTAAAPPAPSRIRRLWSQYGWPGMLYYSGMYAVMGGAIFAYLELSPSGMSNIMSVIDAGADLIGIPWQDYVDMNAANSTLTHAILAVACNEVLDIVRLPFVLVTIPFIFRSRGGNSGNNSA